MNTLEHAIRQALEMMDAGSYIPAMRVLREALAEQAEQEPVGMVIGGVFEPWNDDILSGAHELYAAHVRTKDLTDDEIVLLAKQTNGIYYDCDCVFARAVIASFKEKNLIK